MTSILGDIMNKYWMLAALAIGCGKQHATYEASSATGSTTSDDLSERAESLWAQRGDKAQLAEALSVYEQLYIQDSSSKAISARLVRGWYFYGDAHETEIEAKKVAWNKAIAFGVNCLALNADYKAILDKEGKREDAAAALTKEDVPCTYWTASALGKWAKESGLATTLKHIGAAKAYIAKVEELDPTFFYGAPHRYWGAYYSGLPSFAGQDLDRSKVEFEKALSIAPEYLGTRILLADYWATKNQDQIAVFDEHVQYVMASDPTALDPKLLPENEAEIRKAKALWADRSDRFLDAPAPAPLQEQPPVAEPEPAEEAPADSPAEDAPADSPAEDAPADDSPAEDAPTDDAQPELGQ
jgi:hypothetical protein